MEYVLAALKLAPSLIQAGVELTTLAQQVYNVVSSGNDPTQADWDALDAMGKALSDDLMTPLPPE